MTAPVKFDPEMRAAIRAGDAELPVLLAPEQVRAALDLTPRQLDNLVRDGRLENVVTAGERSLFRTRQVRDYLLSSAPKKPSVSATLKRPLFGKGSRRSRTAVPACPVAPGGSSAPVARISP